MRIVVFVVYWLILLAAAAAVLNAPLMVAARLARRRLRPVVPKVAIAVGFAAATAYMLWNMDWFDVWRHGVPSVEYMLRYVLRYYLPWIASLGLLGWFAGGLLVGQPQPSETIAASGEGATRRR